MQAFVERLMNTQGMTQEEAEKQASALCTKETLYSMWRENDTIWDALEYTYRTYYIESASDEWYDTILPLSKTGNETDYAKFSAMKEDLDMRYGEIDAYAMIKFIQQDYPGKWTTAELMDEFEGITMPSYFTRLVLQTEGVKAVDANINYIYYNMLDADGQRMIREAFGTEFSDIYLEGKGDNLSIELRGSWLDALKEAMGVEDFSWRELPGIEGEVKDSKTTQQATTYGLPTIATKDAEEWAEAQKINKTYWQAVADGNDIVSQQLEDDPLRLKWFGNNTASSYFWNYYYTTIPPFGFSSALRENPILQTLLTKDTRYIVATNSMYDKALTVLQTWYEENEQAIIDAGLDAEEYQQVRDLYSQYILIPEEDKTTRKQFLKDNPLLQKYFNAKPGVEETTIATTTETGTEKKTTKRATSSKGTGGGRSYSSITYNYKETWASLKSMAGQDFSVVLRALIKYWNTGVMSSGAESYLRKLFDVLGGDASWEDWLLSLKRAWLVNSGSSNSIDTSEPKAPPKPEYTRGSSGIRRV